MRWRSSLTVAAVIFAGAPSHATAPASAAPAPAVWQVGWEKSHCTISTTNADGVTLSFWMLPGAPEPKFYLVGSPKFLPIGSYHATVQVGPSDERFPVDAGGWSVGGSTVVESARLPSRFPQAFAGSSEMRVSLGRKEIVVPIPGATRAMAALRDCLDHRLPEWGVDAVAYDALQTPPTEIEGLHWISSDDYPADLLNSSWEGDAVIRLNVDAAGKVTNCAVAVSSGQKSIDSMSCLRASQKLRFNPALGANGTPIAAVRMRDVVWRVAH